MYLGLGSNMTPLEPPDAFHVRAAEGWLELGNHVEANEELERVTPELRTHPDVLKIRWKVYAEAEKWLAALDIATALVQAAPDDPDGWIGRSFSLHELKRTAEARDYLLPAVDKFPKISVMRYNLACYECQLGSLQKAKDWLSKAFELGDAKAIKQMALDDRDLEPLWKEIGNL
jgi:tetratricopeptide (TPR) repeat protein